MKVYNSHIGRLRAEAGQRRAVRTVGEIPRVCEIIGHGCHRLRRRIQGRIQQIDSRQRKRVQMVSFHG